MNCFESMSSEVPINELRSLLRIRFGEKFEVLSKELSTFVVCALKNYLLWRLAGSEAVGPD